MLAPNTILQNRYRIIRQLGQGGMGTVYEAIDERLDTTVALKESHFTEEQLCKQFEREARLLARLRHPAMTRVIDHFTEGDGQFLVMDFIAGEDLWGMLQRNGGAFPQDKVLEWADQLLDALDYLHKQEPPIIHRDIKPQNLKLSNQGQIILLDFGLAKGYAGQISRVTTSSSIFAYTRNYAPLEQIQGTGTDPRSDLYSLAATLFHLMTGVVPPDALTRVTTISDGQPDPLRPAHAVNGQVQPQVADVLSKALAIGRSQRFSTAAEMRQALHEARQLQSTRNARGTETAILPSPSTIHSHASDQIPPISSAQSKQQSYLPSLIIGGVVALVFIGITIAIILNYNSGTANTNTSSFNSNAGNMNLSNMPDTGSNTSPSRSDNQNTLTPPIINGNSSSSNNNLNQSNSNTSSNSVAEPQQPTMRADPASSPQIQSAMDTADRNPRDFEAQKMAAAAFYQTGAYDKAVVYLNRALQLKPTDPDALTAMGNTKYDMGKFTEAATFYERSLRERPNDVNVRTDLGNTYFQRQPPDYDRAIAEYRKSLAIDPKHVQTLVNLAAAAVRTGDKATARDALDRLAAVNPSHPALAKLRSSLDQ